MRRIGPLLMSTVLVAGCAGLAANNQNLSVLLKQGGQNQSKLSAYEQGKQYLQFGSAGRAVDSFQTALKDDPDSVPALNGIAIAYDRLGRVDVAQRFLDRALMLDPYSTVTLNNLAYLNLVQGNTAVALAYAERAKIAAALPMEMKLPEAIANAVERNAEIATQLATNEAKEGPASAIPALPPESDIKRVGLNEWELRIRPPNPANAVRINVPLPEATPRVIESMVQPVTPAIVPEPLAEAVMADIPESVVADLIVPPSEPAPAADALVASVPEPAGMPAPAEVLATSTQDVPLPPAPPAEPNLVPTLGLPALQPVSPLMPDMVVATLLEPPTSAPGIADRIVLPEPVTSSLSAPEPAPAPLPAPLAEFVPAMPTVLRPPVPPAPGPEQVIASVAPQAVRPPAVMPQAIPQFGLAVPSPSLPARPAPAAPPGAQFIAPMVATLAPSVSPLQASPSSFQTFRWTANVPSATRIRVSNGTARELMASRFVRYFSSHNLLVQKISDASSLDYRQTVIFYNPDQRDHAFALASILPFPFRLVEAKQGRGEIELILGADLFAIDDSLRF